MPAAAVLSGLLAGLAAAVLLLRPRPWRLAAALGPPGRPVAGARPRRRAAGRGPGAGGAGPRTAVRAPRATAPHATAPRGTAPRARAGGTAPRARGARLACALAGLAAVLVLGLPAGLAVGAVVALAGPALLGRLEPRADRDERERLAADLPLVLDLLAACLAGGATMPAAAAAVRDAVGGPAAERLARVCAALAVGTAPPDAWRLLAEDAPGSGPRAPRGRRAGRGGDEDPLAAAARALARASEGGAPVASAVARLSTEARAARRSSAEQAARRVGVLAVAPLGLCFLPAFVALGIVPVVVGLAGPLLSGS